MLAGVCTHASPRPGPSPSATATPSPGPSRSVAAASIEAPVRVSGRSTLSGCPKTVGETLDSEVEPSVAADPADPDRLAAVWQQDRSRTGGARAIAAAWSQDGGATWTPVLPPGLTACSGGPYSVASDPVVSIGLGGRAYLSAIAVRGGGVEERGARTEVTVSASPDGGRTWGEPVVVSASTDPRVSVDKESVVADPAIAGAAYVVWIQYTATASGREASTNRTFFARTADGGATWSEPILAYDGRSETQFHQPLAPADGSLVDVFIEAPSLSDRPPIAARVAAIRSTDGGATWSPPVRVASATFTVPTDPAGKDRIRGTGQAVLAAAAPDGSVYVCWAESRRSGGSVFAARSEDGGLTWGPTLTVAEGAGQPFLPQVAVAGTGAIGLTWYEVGETASAAELSTDVRFAWSADRGAHWEEAPITGTFDLRTAPLSQQGDFVGDYQGLAGLPDGFAALDAVARPLAEAGPTDLFFTRVRLEA